ncbi:MAG TPA: hypothetical protein VN201_13380 [Roseateles sp.]|nr:hypothetical protein [Roseateles sp.]
MSSASRAQHHAEFPDNLTPGEHRALQAVMLHGDAEQAAAALRVSVATVRAQTAAARDKARARTTLRLVVLYLLAKGGQA